MTVIEQLGSRIAQGWSRSRYRPDALSEVAATELDRTPLHRELNYQQMLVSMNAIESFPPQTPNIDSGFGEPPLTLYWHPRFYIEALFWCTSTTAIHGHGFVGAFQVLNGTSLQSEFAFDSDAPRVSRCRLGTLRQTDASVLRPGDTQQIAWGERFVHSVFHLGYPSVTIVVRTIGGNPTEPQYTYYRPGVAIPHELAFDQFIKRQHQIARLQAQLGSDQLDATVETIARHGDLAAAFTLLSDVQPILQRQGRVDAMGRLVMTLAAAHGLQPVSTLAEAVTRERALDRLRLARQTVVEDDLRLFLALLLTQQRRRTVLSEVAAYTGSDQPQATVGSWIRQLAARGVLRVPADDAMEPVLGRWLSNGRPEHLAADAGNGAEAAEAARYIELMKGEPLLRPLLFEETA